MLDIQFAMRDQRIFSVFLQQWKERERKYLSEFEDESRASHPLSGNGSRARIPVN